MKSRTLKRNVEICFHIPFQEHGMLSATASLGLIHMWDVDSGLVPIDKSVPESVSLNQWQYVSFESSHVA